MTYLFCFSRNELRYLKDESSLLSDLDNLEMMVNKLMEMDNASLNNINGPIKNDLKKLGEAAKKVFEFFKKNLPTCVSIVTAIL